MMYSRCMENYTNDDAIRKRIIQEKRRRNKRRRMISGTIVLILALVCAHFLGKFIGKKAYSAYNREIVCFTEDVPLVNTAKEQIGNIGGEPYWSWYDFKNRVEWCACFVSWCENELGYIDEEKAPKFAMVGDGIAWFIYRDQWLQPDGNPVAGDLIFFDWDQDDVRDHVGIVSAVSGNKIFAIEGNSSDRCRVKVYDLGDPVIYGYGHIDA